MVDAKLRSVAILAAVREREAAYVWSAQVGAARRNGLGEDVIDLLRAKGDAGRWREAMDRLRAAAKARGELMPEFLEAARANASVGEQVQVLKEVFGVYHDPGYF